MSPAIVCSRCPICLVSATCGANLPPRFGHWKLWACDCSFHSNGARSYVLAHYSRVSFARLGLLSAAPAGAGINRSPRPGGSRPLTPGYSPALLRSEIRIEPPGALKRVRCNLLPLAGMTVPLPRNRARTAMSPGVSMPRAGREIQCPGGAGKNRQPEVSKANPWEQGIKNQARALAGAREMSGGLQ